MGIVERMQKNYSEVRARDERWIMRVNFQKVGTALAALFGVFVVLNLTDVCTTAIALYIGPPFVELNPVASLLFRNQLAGVLAALLLKFMPTIPLGYGVFKKEGGGNAVHIRSIKLGVLVALGAADVLYLGIVTHNITTLITTLL